MDEIYGPVVNFAISLLKVSISREEKIYIIKRFPEHYY